MQKAKEEKEGKKNEFRGKTQTNKVTKNYARRLYETTRSLVTLIQD